MAPRAAGLAAYWKSGAPPVHWLRELLQAVRGSCSMIIEGETMSPADAELADLRRRVGDLEAQVAEREQMVGSLLEREAYFRRLDAEQQRLVAVIEGSSDLVGLASLGGRLIYLNESGRALV